MLFFARLYYAIVKKQFWYFPKYSTTESAIENRSNCRESIDHIFVERQLSLAELLHHFSPSLQIWPSWARRCKGSFMVKPYLWFMSDYVGHVFCGVVHMFLLDSRLAEPRHCPIEYQHAPREQTFLESPGS